MAGRVYECPFNGVAITAVQDLFSIQSTSGMAFIVHEIILTQVTAVTIEAWRLTLRRFSGAYSIGSGGSSGTVTKHNFNDAGNTATVRTNDTTQTTSGTNTLIRADGFNLINGYQYLAIPDKQIIIAPSQAFVLSLDTTPAGSRTVNGSILFEEIF